VSRRPYVIAVDAGGSYTRAACVGLEGSLLARVTGDGSHASHRVKAAGFVRDAVVRAVSAAHLDPGDAVHLVAGLAGLDSEDTGWTDEFTEVAGLTCPREHLNDAVVAHVGAFAGGPGVVVVGGTGSLLLAMNETGDQFRDWDYHHYVGGSRHLAFDLMQRLLVGDDSVEDENLVRAVLSAWAIADREELRIRVVARHDRDPQEVEKDFGRLAPLITAAADSSPLADGACRRLAAKAALGVRLLAAHVETRPVPVTLIGSMVTSPAMATRVADALADQWGDNCRMVSPALSPLGGAALLALRRLGSVTATATAKLTEV
jgi:glucosamine kinase